MGRLTLLAFAMLGASTPACERRAGARPPEHDVAIFSPAPAPQASASPTDAAVASAPVDAGPLPLVSAEIVELDVPGFKPAFLSVPVGATGPKPVVLAVHGLGDRPDWQCMEWRRAVRDRAFVLCPRGQVGGQWSTKNDTRYMFESKDKLFEELDAALAALFARHPAYVDPGPIVYAGFSYGAIHGISYVLRDPSRFAAAVFTEGASDMWTPSRAKDWKDKGGRRVLLVCGQSGCFEAAKGSAQTLTKAGVEAKALYGKGEGHGYGGAVAAEIQRELPWLLEGDARWSP